ncbi:tRNA1(Val) (adenine(37)-N6)-methyltransferase [Lachnoanaerobaculum sp. Marseille-Q4761]|jgi:methyltransferase type 11|uniref:tRNA1(Val) (adenine(37)-N6)-methyltransferase n=1 Tax=Lachnoanaerobaculum sp. Marseille-Q4761 TaxID=2819511 RepID=UPI001AA12AD4|nr:tRNA1(Val) (adenine(37)-N6)-methyltransferase [Lachnoanaerobaculum sp. Marseille-Q4761]MBO1869577.1 tRNA1(Val) (adenine(37)-N6)-methyltransferase [Lachnoanaerobaculum sp. Marseille-Q4761]
MKNELLKEELGERLDDLQCNNLFLIQNPSKFCFGIDAVLLANFVKAKNGGHIIDLCTGSGIVPVLLSAKTSAKRITGIEIQKDIADMANRSVLYNSLEEKIDIINDDIANALKYIKPCSVDTISVNPPYMKDTTAIKNPDLPLAIARHELLTDLETVVGISGKLLKENGKFFMIHKPSRLSEIFAVLKKNRIEPKRIRFVHPYINSKANLVLIEGIKGSGVWLDVEPPLAVYKDKNVYTDEVLKIYGR